MGNCSGICTMKEDPLPIKEINNDEKEKQKKDPENNEIKKDIEKNFENPNQQKNEEIDIDMDFMKEQEDKIIKMQAKMKGNLARKQLKGEQIKKEK